MRRIAYEGHIIKAIESVFGVCSVQGAVKIRVWEQVCRRIDILVVVRRRRAKIIILFDFITIVAV